MLKITLSLLIILAFSIFGQQNVWKKMPTPTKHHLRKMAILDSTTIVACGDSGTILKTTNAGSTWIMTSTNILSDIFDICFVDNKLGFAVTWDMMTNPPGSTILKTTDGGNNWVKKTFSSPDYYFYSVFFTDSLHGVVAGVGQKLFVTEDGGEEWRESVPDSTFSGFPIVGINFRNKNFGFANGGYFDVTGLILKTTDGGYNWRTQAVSPEPIQHVKFIDSLHIVGIGGDFEYGTGIVRSTDGGDTWNYSSIEVYGIGYTLSFRTKKELWAPLGFAQRLIFSADTGKTWIEYPCPDSTGIYDLEFIDSTRGYAVGLHGAFLKYVPAISSATDKTESLSKGANILYQNYPNPIIHSAGKTEITSIDYDILQSGYVIITIYDLLGNKLKTIVDEYKSAGKHTVKFYTDFYPSGTYFYTLRIGDFVANKKFVIVR